MTDEARLDTGLLVPKWVEALLPQRRCVVLHDRRHTWEATMPGGPYYCPVCGERGVLTENQTV